MNPALWSPTAEAIEESAINRFRQFLEQRHGLLIAKEYQKFHDWAVANPELFWAGIWDFCAVVGKNSSDRILVDGDKFPGATWFPDATLNYAENLLQRRDDETALVSLLEDGSRRVLSYAELYQQVAQLADYLKSQGVEVGDRVAGFMPNIQETVVAMLATTAIGAVWSSCSPDFGVSGVIDRFGQIEPKVLFVADGYFYNGKKIDSRPRISEIVAGLPSLEQVIVVTLVTDKPLMDGIRNGVNYSDCIGGRRTELEFVQLPFNHPLFVMYSSGTTGVPKCIVHGAGGTLLQHKKEHQLLVGLAPDDVFFYFTTCGWMMWNWLVSGLASSATLVLYDGAPLLRKGKLLLDAIDREKINVFGISAKFISALEKSGAKPNKTHQLHSLRTVLSTGSPLSHESFEYVYRSIKQDVCLSSISGGTDILSCFVGGCPIVPVYVGEIQAKGLGMAVEIWDDEGQSVVEQKGELVCTKPFPCTPLGFWNDPDGVRYKAAYFDTFPNVWAHGDYGEITANGGIIIHGRSDAVLNPGGVRIGTAEIYRQVEKIEGVMESIVIGQEWKGDVRVVLFVILEAGRSLDDELKKTLKESIKRNTTPRHVPDKIIQVTDIPRTISGKIVELAVRNVVHDRPVKNTDSLANPEALAQFENLPELRS